MSNKNLQEFIIELEKLNIEQISDVLFSPTYKDDQKIKINGKYYINNLKYPQKKLLYVKNKTIKKNFYIRSCGNDKNSNINLLLYSHFKQLQNEDVCGIFSVGGAIDDEFTIKRLLILQIIDIKIIKKIDTLFNKFNFSITKHAHDCFGNKSFIYLLNLTNEKQLSSFKVE